MLSSVYVESIVLRKVAKRFDSTTSPSLLELRALQENFEVTCEELRPKCVPFDSAMFPFCEGRVGERGSGLGLRRVKQYKARLLFVLSCVTFCLFLSCDCLAMSCLMIILCGIVCWLFLLRHRIVHVYYVVFHSIIMFCCLRVLEQGIIADDAPVYSHANSPKPIGGAFFWPGSQSSSFELLSQHAGRVSFLSKDCLPEFRSFYCAAQIKQCHEVLSRNGGGTLAYVSSWPLLLSLSLSLSWPFCHCYSHGHFVAHYFSCWHSTM